MIEPRDGDWGERASGWSAVPDIEPRIPAMLAWCREQYADRELLVMDDRRVTYGEVEAQSALLARRQLAAGVGKGSANQTRCSRRA